MASLRGNVARNLDPLRQGDNFQSGECPVAGAIKAALHRKGRRSYRRRFDSYTLRTQRNLALSNSLFQGLTHPLGERQTFFALPNATTWGAGMRRGRLKGLTAGAAPFNIRARSQTFPATKTASAHGRREDWQ